MKLRSNTKLIYGFLICHLLIGCSIESDFEKSLESVYQHELKEYELQQIRLKNFINESPPLAINNHILSKIPKLDSLLVTTTKMIEAVNSREEIQIIVLNWKKELENINNENISTIQVPAKDLNIYREFSKLKLLQGSRKLLEYISMEVNSTPIRFDNMELIVVPEKPIVKVGEKYKAKIYFAALSSKMGQSIDLLVNELPVIFENGVGEVEWIPNKKGIYSYSVRTVSKRNLIGKQDLEQETRVNYIVN